MASINTISIDGVSYSIEPSNYQTHLYQGEYTGTSGTGGYVKIAQITISSNYENKPITFLCAQRGLSSPFFIFIQFANVNSVDPSLASITYASGTIHTIKIVKNTTSVWDLYVLKSENWDSISVMQVWNPYDGSRLKTTFPGTLSTSDPGGTTATKVTL